MRRVLILVLMGMLNLGLMGAMPPPAPQVVRVGIYENPPKIFTDAAGKAAGFWPDLLEAIARKEGFQIEWVRGSWDDNLHRLDREQIDVMPDVGMTADRINRFAFSSETVLTSWARVYVPRGASVETIFDLAGKKVAGLQGSLNFDGPEGIRQLTEKFNVHCEFVGLSSYEAVFQAIASGQVDAGVTNKDFGDLNEDRYQIQRSPIIIQPTDLRFAFPKNGALTPWLREAIDRQVAAMLADPTSAYYRGLEKYFGQNLQKTFLESIPTWVYELIAISLLAALALLAATIIARRQIQRQTAELRASKERYQALLAHNPDLIVRLSGDGCILDFHSPEENSLHLPLDENVGKNLRDLLPPEIAEVSLEKLRLAAASGEMQMHEVSKTMDGKPLDIEVRYAPSGMDEVTVILRDITTRKQAERELRESERRYQTLTNVSPVGIFHTNRDGRTTYVSPSWCQITGMPADLALGAGWLQAVHPEDRERLAINWQEAAQNQNSSVTDYRFQHADGTVVWVLGQAVPELDADNQPVGFVGTITDITERKKVEALQMAVIKAESADRLKSAFLATMSHELRTPLNSIIGFTGILLQKLVGPLSGEQEKQLAMIQSSAHHLLELINDVLDISKIEAGQLTMINEFFDMGQAVQKSVDKIRPLAEKKGLALTAVVTPPAIEINSDRRRVEQVLLNLLNNGVKFTERGEVRLETCVEDGWLVTRVVDTGIGIAPESVATLFRPFQQVDSGLTRQYEGTGLGLSICKRLVEMLGGRIWVESTPGVGSAFIFTLPVK